MIHTSESLQAQDGHWLENEHYQLEDGQRYQLTEGELEWLEFVRGMYAIADHLSNNMDESGIYTVDTFGMSEALADDGSFPKAACLSDDTTLQSVFFYNCFDIED